MRLRKRASVSKRINYSNRKVQMHTGLHSGHHLDRILKVVVRKVQRLFDN